MIRKYLKVFAYYRNLSFPFIHSKKESVGFCRVILNFRFAQNTETELIFFLLWFHWNLWYMKTFFFPFLVYSVSKVTVMATAFIYDLRCIEKCNLHIVPQNNRYQHTKHETWDMREHFMFYTNPKLFNHDSNNENWTLNTQHRTLHVRWQRLKILKTFSINISCRPPWMVRKGCNFMHFQRSLVNEWILMVWWMEFFN